MESKTILAVESSCDETAAAVVRVGEGKSGYDFEVVSNVVASQIDLHKKWGGVYPELASRAHLEAMIPVLTEALEPLGDGFKGLEKIDAVAVTAGPGLIGSLLMGFEAAKIICALYKKPLIAVNHLEGHIYASFAHKEKFLVPKNAIFPCIALIVSGGHTSLVLIRDHLQYKTVGETIDDAAGEAFDKVARILDLGYPGGPAVENLASQGDDSAYDLPLSMLSSKDLNFSFSGLKTAVLYKTKNPATGEKREFDRAGLAASFQKTVSKILTQKTIKAINAHNAKTVILSGGVSANGYLRSYFLKQISKDTKAKILIPPKNLSTDNALGIAITGAMHFLKKQGNPVCKSAKPNWKIDENY
jgi:N6-L-threonylcarbamoyladenine synthase